MTPSHCVSHLSSPSTTRRVITHRQQVDESNDEVQQLLEANMGTVEECIRAIEHYGTANIAYHKMQIETDDSLFHDSGVSESQALTVSKQQVARCVKRPFLYVGCYCIFNILTEMMLSKSQRGTLKNYT